jgi:putative FmdB family regulatory protein
MHDQGLHVRELSARRRGRACERWPLTERGSHASIEFRCESCEKSFEATLTLTERANLEVKCPNCGSDKVAPQLTVFTARTSRKG